MSKTQSTAAKLSDTQLVILGAATQRADRSLLPFPQSLTAKGAALEKVVETLCKRKLAEERQAIDGAVEWRRDDTDSPLGLFITTSGLLAIGLGDAKKSPLSQAAANMPRQSKTAAAPRHKVRKASRIHSKRRAAPPQTKQNLVIEMLRRKPGVSIEDIIAKTKWQPHSVRGFFSAVVRKKLNLPLVSNVSKDGVRRYHIAPIESSNS